MSPPYAGKFSNGPVLPEITAQLLGAKLINFSFGGAEALGTQTLEDAAGPAIPDQVKAEIAALPPDQRAQIDAVLDKNINLSGQMADLVAETSAHLPSAHSALVSLIGLNDLQALEGTFDPSNPLALIGEVAQVAAGIVHADLGVAHTAFSQGIGTVIFETLPAPSFFPAGKELAQTGMAFAHFLAGRYEDGTSWATTALQLQHNFLSTQRVAMACYAMSGRVYEAQQSCALAMQTDPTQRISQIKDRNPFRRPEDIERFAQAFRIAGMPE